MTKKYLFLSMTVLAMVLINNLISCSEQRGEQRSSLKTLSGYSAKSNWLGYNIHASPKDPPPKSCK